PDSPLSRGVPRDGRPRPVARVSPYPAAAARADTALRLALDRAADISRADPRGHPLHRRQRHVSGRGLELVARRRIGTGLGAGRGDAAADDAGDRSLLAAGAAPGAQGGVEAGRGLVDRAHASYDSRGSSMETNAWSAPCIRTPRSFQLPRSAPGLRRGLTRSIGN